MARQNGTTSYVDPYRDPQGLRPLTAEERTLLRSVNQRIAAKPGLVDVVNYLFDETQALIPCDRMSFAFIEEDGRRVTSYFTRAAYEPILLRKGYSEDMHGSSLQPVLHTGTPRIIGDLQQYLDEHPRSRSTRLLVKEGVRSSLTCPLQVEGRVVGFMFRSSREAFKYTRKHVELQMSVTERLSQAVEKAWRIEQLEQANRAYFELLGFVSHELKSPLASLVTDARLLTGGYLGELEQPQKDRVERMAQKGEFLIDLIREYLDLSQVEGGELVLHPHTDVRVADDLILPVVELLRTQLDSHDLKLTTEVTPADAVVECDPALLRIALSNFLGNAAKYGAPGGQVRVTARRSDNELSVSVWNEGPGFPRDQRGKLFRKFTRLSTPELKKRRGTGLGLYNAWRIIELHNGRVTADSEEGAWAEFSFVIPQPLTAVPRDTQATDGGEP
jgi:signal transduction histidine kinase